MGNQVTHSLVKALRRVPALASLDDATLLTLVGGSANLFWNARSTVFEKGDEADGLYIVLSGSVRIYDDGHPELATIGAGDFFGELSLMLDTARTRSAAALEDSELLVVPKESFQALVESSADVAEIVRRAVEQRTAAVQRDT